MLADRGESHRTDLNADEFRKEMEAYRSAVEDEARSLKDSSLVLGRLYSLYRKFDADERAMADCVLAEWALSPDENLRFDALALIDEFRIAKATPALKTLAGRLASSETPGAPYELQKVNRILREFGEDSSSC